MGTFITESILSEGGITGTTADISNGINVTGMSNFTGIINHSGSLNITGNTTVNGLTTITNGLTVVGATTITGAFSATTVSGDGSGLTNITSSTDYGIVYSISNSYLYI